MPKYSASGVALIAVMLAGFLLRATPQQAASPDVVSRKLSAGAAFLKSGEPGLAVKIFADIVNDDPANWRARSLLLLGYLGTGEVDKAQTELRRLRSLQIPPEPLATLERQVGGVAARIKLRDDVSGLLAVGKSEQAVSTIDKSDLSQAKKQLLRAYIAALRGHFDEAWQLTASDPEAAAFTDSIAKRAEDFKAARETAMVAMNYLGSRYCGKYVGEMRRCEGQAPLTSAQQAAWNEIRSGKGKASPMFMRENLGIKDLWSGPKLVFQVPAVQRARLDPALAFITRFVSLAPLDPEAIDGAVVLALYSGSLEATRAAAERSINATGVWALRTRQCPKGPMMACTVGEDQPSRLFDEGVVLLDVHSRVLRYHAIPAKDWLTSMTPTLGATQFEIPFDRITSLKSRPEAKTTGDMGGPWIESKSLLFDFGANKTVPMTLDFIYPLNGSESTAVVFKAVEDILDVVSHLVPSAKVDYQPEYAKGMSEFRKVLLAANAGAQSAAGNSAAAQQSLQAINERAQADAKRQQTVSGAMADLRLADGTSMIDSIFTIDIKPDVDKLLALTLTGGR